jgi:hypothetical protein
MNIKVIRSDEIYRKMISASDEKREDIFRNELLKPFEFKWQCIGVPLKAETVGGFDAVAAIRMGGSYAPAQITENVLPEVEMIRDNSFWNACEKNIRNTLEEFERHGIKLPTEKYTFTILLNDPNNPMSAMTGDYCGDGGIPGYIIGTIIPNEKSLQMLPVALSHEANHNVRWQFMQWSPNVTLAEALELYRQKYNEAWFAEGGILTKPTIFGSMGNTLLGGGEAGYEAILPLSKLSGMIADMLKKLLPNMTMSIDSSGIGSLMAMKQGTNISNVSSTTNNIDRGITQNLTIISPAALSPSETARKNKQAARQLAMEWS